MERMAEERSLLVGVDLCEDFSQISCFNNVSLEPESICYDGECERYLVPTVLFYKRDTAEWFFGEEALTVMQQEQGVFIKNILSIASRQDFVEIDGQKVKPVFLLEKFLKRLLAMLKPEYPNNTIRKLVVTVKDKNMILIQNIYAALQNLGISKVRASVESHEQSFVHFAMNQPKELRVNDIALFDFSEDGLMFYQLSTNRRTTPHSVVLKKRDFRETLSYDFLKDDPTRENISYLFENIAMNALHKQIVSTVYVPGKGFEGDWSRDTLKALCEGRRVFVGQNLYVKGAGYAAREAIGEGRKKEYLYLGDEVLGVNISMPLYTKSQMVEYPLVTAGTAWYNAAKVISFISDGELEVELKIEYVIGNQISSHFISMDGLRHLSRKSRIEMSVEFTDVRTCVVTLRDKGFGELYPSSNRVWEKIIYIDGNKSSYTDAGADGK